LITLFVSIKVIHLLREWHYPNSRGKFGSDLEENKIRTNHFYRFRLVFIFQLF